MYGLLVIKVGSPKLEVTKWEVGSGKLEVEVRSWKLINIKILDYLM